MRPLKHGLHAIWANNKWSRVCRSSVVYWKLKTHSDGTCWSQREFNTRPERRYRLEEEKKPNEKATKSQEKSASFIKWYRKKQTKNNNVNRPCKSGLWDGNEASEEILQGGTQALLQQAALELKTKHRKQNVRYRKDGTNLRSSVPLTLPYHHTRC